MEKFKQFNLDNNIPIMRDQTIDYLFHMFDSYNNAEVLEIGTAYGYSAKYLAQHQNISKVVTLENDLNRHNVALKYLKNEI